MKRITAGHFEITDKNRAKVTVALYGNEFAAVYGCHEFIF